MYMCMLMGKKANMPELEHYTDKFFVYLNADKNKSSYNSQTPVT